MDFHTYLDCLVEQDVTSKCVKLHLALILTYRLKLLYQAGNLLNACGITNTSVTLTGKWDDELKGILLTAIRIRHQTVSTETMNATIINEAFKVNR